MTEFEMVSKYQEPAEPLTEIAAIDRIECGVDAARYFAFENGYRNLNHGSFGTYPTPVRSVLRGHQELAEANPDKFLRYTYPGLLDVSRQALAKHLNAPVETCVIVSNATTAVNVVLRNLVYQPGDVVVYFDTLYGACEKTVDYLTETTPAESKRIKHVYPISDERLCTLFENTLTDLKKAGKKPVIAIFDTICSQPGVRVPFTRLAHICRAHDVLSCIDGAHSIGQIPLDLTALDPDFYVSNCHKWLHVPRACAVFYVPLRNQHLIRSTLPTSHGFVPKGGDGSIINPLPAPSGKSDFAYQFEYVGTLDSTPYLCIRAALEWRSKFVLRDLRGEAAIMAYCKELARIGGDAVAKTLGTEVMDNEEGTLRDCAFAQIRLPIVDPSGSKIVEMATLIKIAQWSEKVLNDEYHTFIAARIHAGEIWVRLSAQVYLTVKDFEWAARTLQEICERVKAGEWEAKGR